MIHWFFFFLIRLQLNIQKEVPNSETNDRIENEQWITFNY